MSESVSTRKTKDFFSLRQSLTQIIKRKKSALEFMRQKVFKWILNRQLSFNNWNRRQYGHKNELEQCSISFAIISYFSDFWSVQRCFHYGAVWCAKRNQPIRLIRRQIMCSQQDKLAFLPWCCRLPVEHLEFEHFWVSFSQWFFVILYTFPIFMYVNVANVCLCVFSKISFLKN